jgi:TRAP transporter TAXI family solute receptor
MNRLFVVLILALFAFTPEVSAQKKETRVPFLQYPLGGGWEGYFIFDRLVADAHPWLRPFQQETPGYVYNLKLFARDKNMQRTATFGSSTGAEWLADKGIKPFFDDPIKVDWKWLYGETLHGNSWFVTTDPSVKTVADLKGKPIAIGLKTQTHWGGFAYTLLKEGYGITEENTRIEFLGPAKGIDTLLDGRVVAALVQMNVDAMLREVVPGSILTRVAASGKQWRYLDIPREVVEKVNRQTGSPFIPLEFPPNTLPNQPQKLQWFADVGVRAVHPDFPEELAYEVTKAFIQHGPKAGQFVALGKTWNKETMVRPFADAPNKVHPGARRAFEEAGLWPPEKVLGKK